MPSGCVNHFERGENVDGNMSVELMYNELREQAAAQFNEKEVAVIEKAFEIASQKHNGQKRRSGEPYIIHPVAVAKIVLDYGMDYQSVAAAMLHDTVEDTDTTLDEIKELFGDDVAMLVASNSEDKSKSWDERKSHTINELLVADERVKMLIMADKLSNLRSIAYDYSVKGDGLWVRFNAPKGKQAWYYDGILDALYDLQYNPQCEKAYWELTGLFKDVFVKYYLDSENNTIYQSCDTGVIYSLMKGSPVWKNVIDELSSNISENIVSDDNKPQFYSLNLIPEDAVPISRKEAELTEDIWNSQS